MAELLKSCRSKTCRHTLLGPMERSRRGYSFTDLAPCLTDQSGRLRHLRPHQDFQYFFHLRLPHRHHRRGFYTHSLCPQCVLPRTQLPEDNPALPHRNRSAHAARFTALTIPVMMIYAVLGLPRNALEQHPLLHRGDLGDPSPCFPPNEPPVHRCVPIGKLQALLSCLPTPWSEMSFFMCS